MPPESDKTTDDEQKADFRMELVEEKEEDIGRPADAGALSGEPPEVLRLVSNEPPKRFKGKLFSLKNNATKRNVPNFISATGRSFNYEEMYDEDKYGEEAFPDARVWKVYNDEAQLFDLERIEAWRDAVDVLLVFIGLFAAVVSAFLIETSKSLQPDYAQVNVMISYAILRALNSSVPPHPTLSPDVLNPQLGDATKGHGVVNALWYTSLTTSLSTALLAMLIKQWLHQYMTSTSGTARERARMRQFRYAGLEKYHVPFIIDLLPTLLHVALGLFLVGLAIYLRPLDNLMFGLVVIIASIPYLFYFVSITIPFLDPQCPYKSPPSLYLYQLAGILSRLLQYVWREIKMFRTRIKDVVTCYINASKDLEASSKDEDGDDYDSTGSTQPSSAVKTLETPRYSLNTTEKKAVFQKGDQLDVDGIVYLCQTSSNTNVQNIALEAFSGLAPSDADLATFDAIVYSDLYTDIRSCCAVGWGWDNVPARGMERRHDRLIRALCIREELNLQRPYYLIPYHTSQMDCYTIYSQHIFPWFQQRGRRDESFVGDFILASQQTFPLSIWATLFRLAQHYQPNNVVIRAILVAPLRLPLDSSEMAVVTFERAMQNSKVRAIALASLGVPDVEHPTYLSLCLSAIPPLFLDENAEILEIAGQDLSPSNPASSSRIGRILSFLLPPLLKSITYQSWGVSLGDDSTITKMLHTLITDIFSSPEIEHMSWETLSWVLEVWAASLSYSNGTISTPLAIRGILEQFRRRPSPFEEDVKWIRSAVRSLSGIFFHCCQGDTSRELSKVLFSTLWGLDFLSVDTIPRAGLSTIRLFWSVSMCEKILGQAHGFCGTPSWRGEEWLDSWLEYIHVPQRLAFLCSRLLAIDRTSLSDLCQLCPEYPSWPTVIETLLSLLENQTYLDSVVDRDGRRILNCRKTLSENLTVMKRELVNHHPILSQPEFDIPQFDDEDNPILNHDGTPLVHQNWTPRSLSCETVSESDSDFTESSLTTKQILEPSRWEPHLVDADLDPDGRPSSRAGGNPVDPSSPVPPTIESPEIEPSTSLDRNAATTCTASDAPSCTELPLHPLPDEIVDQKR